MVYWYSNTRYIDTYFITNLVWFLQLFIWHRAEAPHGVSRPGLCQQVVKQLSQPVSEICSISKKNAIQLLIVAFSQVQTI